MPPYTRELDQAWLEGRAIIQPRRPVEPQPFLHPEVHALRQALEQLKAARYWSQTDPAIRDACRAVVAEIADELRHHTDGPTGNEDEATQQGTGEEAIPCTAIDSPSTGPAPGPRRDSPTECGDRSPETAAARAGSEVRSAVEALAGRRHRAEQVRNARSRQAGQSTTAPNAHESPTTHEGPGPYAAT